MARVLGSQMLSDYAGGKIIVKCPCGLTARYDANEMLRRTGDVGLTHLLDKITRASGCTKQAGGVDVYDLCQARYDMPAMIEIIDGKKNSAP